MKRIHIKQQVKHILKQQLTPVLKLNTFTPPFNEVL